MCLSCFIFVRIIRNVRYLLLKPKTVLTADSSRLVILYYFAMSTYSFLTFHRIIIMSYISQEKT